MVAEVVAGLAALYLIKRLVDILTNALEPETGHLSQAMLYVALTGTATLLHLTAKALSSFAQEVQGQFVSDHVDGLIHNRAVVADLAFYESPRYFDTLRRARESGPTRPAKVVGNLLQMGQNTIMLVAIGGLMSSIHWLLLPVLLVGVIPGLMVRIHFTKVLYKWNRRRTQLYRRAIYIDGLIISDYHAKELRLNQLGDYLKEVHKSLRTLIRQEQIGISQRRTLLELIIAILGTLAFFLSLIYLAWQTSLGKISVGNLVLFLLVFQRGQATVQALLGNVSKLYEDHLYIGQLFEFMDLRPTLIGPTKPLIVPRPMNQGIIIENVTFQYPGAPEVALHNISLAIAPGQIVAMVGANGSGKTTLIKVLCRLYDPTEGRILLDGIDVREFDIDDYRRVFSVIFQDYAKYSLTVRENIRFGDIILPENSPAIANAAVASGADEFIQELRYGYDTQLSRVFDDGQELSTGQWQKIALARSFLHQSQIIVLDEPTSALDANAEFELFRDFRNRIGHRSAVVISHRLSTVRQADYIYVLDKGRINEQGTHDALIAQRGIYQRMFERQAFYYQDSVRSSPWMS